MPDWVKLDPNWKLQDVQAGLNVILTIVFAGATFSLVRWPWLLAARKVLQGQRVPAYLLLSLNSIGETVDVINLLRFELFSVRFLGLLIQCVCVVLLTLATLVSGFIARYSTGHGTILQPQQVSGLMAERATSSLQYVVSPVNATMKMLTRANFPSTQLLEFLPSAEQNWTFDREHWNSSWTMNCSFENEVPISNLVSTGDCTNPAISEIPRISDNWVDWNMSLGLWSFEWTAWRNNHTIFNDVLIFSHGIETEEFDSSLNDTMTKGRVRTVAIHLSGVPVNRNSSTDCFFSRGHIARASYSMFTCDLKRDVQGRSWEESYWGACPDGYDIDVQTNTYLQHYANDLREISQSEKEYKLMPAAELVTLYQAYLITKDTSRSTPGERKISVYVEVAQLSLKTIIICAIAICLLLCSVGYYWIFLWTNRHKLSEVPQSKLDWMLHGLKENQDESGSVGFRRRETHRRSQSTTDSTAALVDSNDDGLNSALRSWDAAAAHTTNLGFEMSIQDRSKRHSVLEP